MKYAALVVVVAALAAWLRIPTRAEPQCDVSGPYTEHVILDFCDDGTVRWHLEPMKP